MTSIASPSTVPTALQSHVSAFAGSPEIARLYLAIAKHEGRVVGVACFSALHYSRRDEKPLAVEVLLFAGDRDYRLCPPSLTAPYSVVAAARQSPPPHTLGCR